MKRGNVIEVAKFSSKEFIKKLVFVEKVDQGLKQLDQGKIVSHAQVKEMVKSFGQI